MGEPTAGVRGGSHPLCRGGCSKAAGLCLSLQEAPLLGVYLASKKRLQHWTQEEDECLNESKDGMARLKNL